MSKLVEMKNIYKSFFGVEVLHDVNFELNAGEVVALCGENGAGKSTLMKILAAVYDSDKGEVFVNGNPMPKNATTLDMAGMGVSMIHQELNLMDHLTVAQNIFLTREIMGKNGLIDHHKMNVEARKLLDMLGQNEIDEKEYVRNLKIAQKQMVEIAKAVSFDVKVLIMDEPTSMLTSRETTILFDLIRRLASEGMGIVYISHRLAEIKEVCDKVTILRDGSLIATKEVAEISEQEIANLMVGREVTYRKAGNFKGDPNDVLLEVQNVSDSFLKDLSFKVRRGEILGFSGLVGAGRSELMEFIFGIRKCQSGKILVEGKEVVIHSPKDAIQHGLGFATEDRRQTGLLMGRSIKENINLIEQIKTPGQWIYASKMSSNAKRLIEELNIKCYSQEQYASNLSGGNQQKVVFGKWLLAEPEVLILDEPTRGIDVGARAEIYEIIEKLAEGGKAIIIVSSDLTEILSVCQRVIVMHEGKITGMLNSDECTEESIMQYATNVAAEKEGEKTA